ncbi:MAG TPA: tripartite tricarboxylate transporter substrate-binding protein, partial [Burkholderiales bacterium]|nr:tripartite tricarboxylate transporter substrate-binding protein [Burkholderiales bacterium]
TDLVHIPYKGANVSLTELMGGQVSVMFAALGSITSMLGTHRVRAIAVAARERTPLLPDVPAIAEQGVPDFEVMNWFGIVAPAGTPPAIIEHLNRAINGVVGSPESRERFASLGFVPRATTPMELDRHIRSEIERWRAVIKAQHIKPE